MRGWPFIHRMITNWQTGEQTCLWRGTNLEQRCCWGNIIAKSFNCTVLCGWETTRGNACWEVVCCNEVPLGMWGKWNSFLSGWVGGAFISGIRAYEISDDVTKFYAQRKVSDAATRYDKFASPIRASVTLQYLNKESWNTTMFRTRRVLLLCSLLLPAYW